MDIKIGIQSDLLSNQPPIHGPLESRPPSSVSSDSLDEEDVAGAVWDELDAVLRAQEEVILQTEGATLMGDEYIDEDAQFDASGIRRDTPSTPTFRRVNTVTIPNITRSSRPLISCPSPDSGSHRPTPSRPPSPLRPPISGVEYEHQPRPPASQPYLTVPVQEPRVGPESDRGFQEGGRARVSPTGRFSACPDQISALKNPSTWVHGRVIATLGDTFCHNAHAEIRERRYDTLPCDLFLFWEEYQKRNTSVQDFWLTCSDLKRAVSPHECRVWLVPVLLDSHWHLLVFDWIDSELRVFDSFATNPPNLRLIAFGESLQGFAVESFNLCRQEWRVVPEQVRSHH